MINTPLAFHQYPIFRKSALAIAISCILFSQHAFAGGYVDPATVNVAATTTGITSILSSTTIDVGLLPAGNPGAANGTGQYYGVYTQAQESDLSGSSLLVSGEGATVIQGWNDGASQTASLVVNGADSTYGTTVNGGLSATSYNGAYSLSVSDGSASIVGGNSTLDVQNGTAALTSGNNGYTTYSSTQTLSNAPATLAAQLNNVGDAASRQNIAGASYVNRLEGNTLVNGNMYINGTLQYTSNSSATTTVTSGASVLTDSTENTTGQMSIANAGASGAIVDGNGKISTGIVNQSTASLTLTNGYGNTHGVVVTENSTVLSGGAHSSTMALTDNGATFSNAANGAPIQLHGVADGSNPFDAVNVRQLDKVATRAYSGIAQIAAMQAVPAPIAGKTYSIGMGGGFYAGQQAVAFGGKALVGDSLSVGASVSTGFGNTNDMAASVGAGFSW